MRKLTLGSWLPLSLFYASSVYLSLRFVADFQPYSELVLLVTVLAAVGGLVIGASFELDKEKGGI